MGGYKKNKIILNNTKSIEFDAAEDVLKGEMKKLPHWHFESKYYDPHGYWGFLFSDNAGNKILFGSERSFFDFYLEIKGTKIDLSHYNIDIGNLKAINVENIQIVIEAIKDALIDIT